MKTIHLISIFCMLLLLPLTVFSEGFECKKIKISGTDYLYCPHNQSLYRRIAGVSQKRLDAIKSKKRLLEIMNSNSTDSIQENSDSSDNSDSGNISR